MLLLDDTSAQHNSHGHTLTALNAAYRAGPGSLAGIEQLVLRLAAPRKGAELHLAYAAYQALYAQHRLLGYAHASWRCGWRGGSTSGTGGVVSREAGSGTSLCLQLGLQAALSGTAGGPGHAAALSV